MTLAKVRLNRIVEIFKILAAYDFPEIIRLIYKHLKAKVVSPDGDTDFFEILLGVMHGNSLTPYLLFIVLDYAMRKANKGREEELGFTIKKCQHRRITPVSITDLDFAKGIIILSNIIEQASNCYKMLSWNGEK